MAPHKNMYFIPQAYVVSSNGIRVEFGGITGFGDQMDKNMMFLLVNGEAGLFKGLLGHPAPNKINDEQMEFYLNQLKTGPNFRLYNIEVQQKISLGTPWCFENLKSYIINVTASVRESNTKSDSITIDKNKDKDAEKDLLLDMQETIEKLRQEVTEKEKLIKNCVSGTRESLNTNPILQNILQIVESNQQSSDKNFKSLEVVTSHMEHMINKKG